MRQEKEDTSKKKSRSVELPSKGTYIVHVQCSSTGQGTLFHYMLY